METSRLQTPKTFFVQEMRNAYSRWKMAFFRELFQNSVDAGAKNIHVAVSLEKAVGAFGDDPGTDEVIRISFEDDGSGMTADILDNVYFRIGESTKRGSDDSIGGFGRARLLNFAQQRYALVTLDSAVEGSGAEYVHRSFAEMADMLEAKAASIRLDASAEDASASDRAIDLEARAKELRGQATKGTFKGCRITIDIDTKMYGEDNWQNPTIDEMMRELSSYLKTSQLPCKVFVNGEERKERLMKGPARRTLSATLPDGYVVPFASVHTNKSKSADFAKTMFVRVAGATMFQTGIEADMQVIIEIDPSVAREALTSNRDGFRSPYSDAYDQLKTELIADVRSALDDRENVHTTHAGGLGRMTARRPVDELAEMKDIGQDEEESPAPRPVRASAARESRAVSKLESEGYAGIPFPVLKWFFHQMALYKPDVLEGPRHEDLRHRVYMGTSGRHGVEQVRAGLDALKPEELEFVLGLLSARMAAVDEQARKAAAERLAGLPDVHVHIKGDVGEKLRKAINRNDPRKWDPEKGQGKAARGLLAAWTVCCEAAIRTLLKHHPHTAPEAFSWSPGFIYTAPKKDYILNESRDAFMIDAEYVHISETDERFFLINPVDSEGHLKYRPAEREDLQKMAVLAAHEVAHVMQKYHDENFAILLTSIMSNLDLQDIRQRTNEALKEIRDLYAKGRVKVQAMDAETGPRPADRLLANIAPKATAAAGIIDAFTPNGCDSAAATALSEITQHNDDGTVGYDFEAADRLEREIEQSLILERDLEPAVVINP